MSLLAALKLPVLPPAAPPAQPEAGVRGRDAAAFEQAKKLRDGMKDQLDKGWGEAVEIAKKLGTVAKKGFVIQLQEVDRKRQQARRLDGDPPGQVVVMAAALMDLKQARQAVGKPVSDGTDANTAYKSADGISVEKPTSSAPAPPPVVAKKDAAQQQDPKQPARAPPEVADLPQPVAADCKPARGRVPGPAYHLYCSTHGHVLDIKAKTIIARDLGDYKKRFPALVAANRRAAQANASKPSKTVNMEETQIIGGTSMHLPTKAEAKAEADAKLKVDAAEHASREAERKHGEVAKLPAHATQSAKAGTSRSGAASANATLVIESFAFAKTDVPASHLSHLKDLRERLAAAPSSTVLLVGHTDTVGTELNNRKLGLERAAAVRTLLTGSQGISDGLVRLDSAGESRPAAGEPPPKLDPNKGERNSRNRRVEVFVTWSKVAPVPPAPKGPAKKGEPERPPRPVDDPHPNGGRVGVTFEHVWESPDFGEWKTKWVKGSFKVKGKVKGELVQKGSGGKVTAGYTTNKGVKLLMGLGIQKSVEILGGLSLKKVEETFEPEFSVKKFELKFQIKAFMETPVPWLMVVVAGSFVLVGVNWKKIVKDQGDFQVATFMVAGGAQGKGTIDLGDNWEANVSIELTVEGSAGPNWSAIIADAAVKAAIDAAETAALAEGAEAGSAVISFEVLITAGSVALGASVVIGLLKTMVDVEEIQGLPKLVENTTRAFRAGYAAGILGEKEPGDPLAKPGFELGEKNFEYSKQAFRAKDPSMTDKKIRNALRVRIREKWEKLYWIFRPYAQQAVWDAFGSSHVGWVNRNIDPSTVRWGYSAIYDNRKPSESDANYMKYYLK